MKVLVRPGKKERFPKIIYEGSIEDADLALNEGQLVLSIIADDIYTKNATQRYTLILDPQDQAFINEATSRSDARPAPA